ncbi:MAG: LysR family transcriptional regulator [Ruminococcaceae bacterium]|nr:LysR family transcriptional regulator [Oscillospiraceae bacterium]
MNIFHLKYAIEVAKAGSINKAGENLGMAQPNISRALKDLEADIGINIFDRSSKGMNLTPEGKEFITYAQQILYHLDELENMYKGASGNRQKFSVSAPRAGYIAEAFAEFSKNINGSSAEVILKETGVHNTVKSIIGSDCKLGIIRYEAEADRYFKELILEKGLEYKPLTVFNFAILTSKNSELASVEKITQEDLKNKIQITHTDPYAATLTAANAYKEASQEDSDKCIYVLDSAAQLELLSQNADTFMWVSPVPDAILERYNLVQKYSDLNSSKYMDVLIYRKDYKLTELDKAFIEEVTRAAEKYL